MVKKRARKVRRSGFDKELRDIDKNINILDRDFNKQAKDVERWVIERRKFFIKLGFVLALIIILIIVSNILLTVRS